MSSKQIILIKQNIDWLRNCFLILLVTYLENYYYDCCNNYFSRSIWAPMFWQWNCVSKEVSFNYLHVICGIEERVSLDWFRSGNSRGLLLDKKSQKSHIFLSNFSLLRTFFSGLSNHVPYRTFLIQKLWYCFKLVKVNLIFHFQ